MKILIFYASYGGGHLSAANSIKSYIESNYKNSIIEMCDCMKYINKPIEKITTDAYKIMAKDVPKAWGMIYKWSDKGPIFHISNFNNEMMSKKLHKMFIEFNPDIVISTHPFSTQMSAYLKKTGKIKCKIASIMTDFASQNQWLVGNEYVDYIFVSNKEMRDVIIKKGVDEKKVFATGIPLSLRFQEKFDKEKIYEEFKLKKKKKIILFFGGGEFGLAKEATTEVLKQFVKNLQNKYQIVIISGKNDKIHQKFEEIVKEEKQEENAKVLGFTNMVPELMSISYMVVTKPGGLTSTESISSNLPMIIINPIPGQEEENARYLEKNEVAIWLHDDDNFKEKIKQILEDDKKIEEMREKTKKIANINSTRDIVKTIMNEQSLQNNN